MNRGLQMKVLVLGAGFGGLELSTKLSEELGDEVEVTLSSEATAGWWAAPSRVPRCS